MATDKVEEWMKRAASSIGWHAEVPFGCEDEFARIIAAHAPKPEDQPIRRGDVVQAIERVIGELSFSDGDAFEHVMPRGMTKVVCRVGGTELILDEVAHRGLHTSLKASAKSFVRIGRAKFYPDGTPVEDNAC